MNNFFVMDSSLEQFGIIYYIKSHTKFFLCDLMIFIIRILCYFTTTCSSDKTFETTCCIQIAHLDNYEIHSIKKRSCMTFVMFFKHMYMVYNVNVFYITSRNTFHFLPYLHENLRLDDNHQIG